MAATAPREASATFDGVDIHWLEHGPESGPVALLLHGFPDSAHTWRHLGPALADAGYRVVAPWLRGYAPSSVPEDGAYGTGRLAKDAAALVDHLGASDPVLIGHDWGAIIGYGAVASQPQRWRKLVTMAVPPLGALMAGFFTYAQVRRSWYMFVFQHPLAESIVAADDLHFIDGLWKEWSPGYDAHHDLPLVKDALRDEANLRAALGYYRAMLGEPSGDDGPDPADAAAFLPSPVPTLYLHGADDGCMGAELVADAGAYLGAEGSRTEILPGVGHFLHLEDPDRVNSLVVDFLAG